VHAKSVSKMMAPLIFFDFLAQKPNNPWRSLTSKLFDLNQSMVNGRSPFPITPRVRSSLQAGLQDGRPT
jgi:hypothetical protein